MLLGLPRNIIAIPILVSCCIGFVQFSWSADRAGENPPPKLGVTDVVGSRDGETDVTRTPATVIKMDFNARSGRQINDAGDVVRYAPGVSIPLDIAGADPYVPYGNNGFSSYRIRGVGDNRVLLTLDGIRQPPEYFQSGGSGNTFFDPQVYGGVEILKGTTSAQYGSGGIGGSVAYRSRGLIEGLEYSPRSWAVRAATTLKSANSSINALGGIAGRDGSAYYEVVDSYTEGSERKNDKGNVGANPLDFQQNHFLMRAAFIPDSGEHRLILAGERFDYNGQTHLNSAERFAIPGEEIFAYNTSTNTRERLSLTYTHTPEAGFWERLDTTVYVQDTDSKSMNIRNSEEINSITFQGQIYYTTNGNYRTDVLRFKTKSAGMLFSAINHFDTGAFEHDLTYGGELSAEHGDNPFERTRHSTSNPNPVNESPTDFDPANIYRTEVFVEDAVNRGRWTLIGGMRLNNYLLVHENDPDYLQNTGGEPRDDYRNLTLNPSASLQYQLRPNTMLWGRYANGVRNPTIEEIAGYFSHPGGVDIEPNPDLTAESSNAFEVGIKSGHRGWYLGGSCYYTFYADFIKMVDAGRTNGTQPIMTRDNVGKVDVYGTEWSLDLFPGDFWTPLDGFSAGMNLNWTYGYNHTEDDVEDSVDPFESVVYVAYDHASGKWGTRLSGTYRAEKEEVSREWVEDGYFIPPSSFVLDWSAYWNITKWITVEADIRNLTDEKYWLWSNAGRTTHPTNEDPEYAVQSGINGVLSMNVVF